MKLEIYDKQDKLVCKIDDDEALFGSFPIDDEMRLHVSNYLLYYRLLIFIMSNSLLGSELSVG